LGADRATRIKEQLPAPVVALARPLVRGVVQGVHRARQIVRMGRRGVSHWQKEFFLRHRLAPWGEATFNVLANARAPRDAYRRRLMARRFTAEHASVRLSGDTGHVLLDLHQLEGVDEVLRTCQRLFAAKVASPGSMARDADGKRGFLRNLLTNDDLQTHTELVRFALSDQLLAAATEYLGTIPHLNRVDLLYSIPRTGDTLEASQLFHLDPEGLRQVKLFLNVHDVGDPEGPFTFIPADASRRLIQEIRARRLREGVPVVGRYSDEEIGQLGGTPSIVEVRGSAGTGVLVDTCRCLHCGSRVQAGSYRLCLYIQYCTSREQGNVFDIQQFSDDPVRYLAVVRSRMSMGARIAAPHQM
jgi:hypothetical protein